MAALGLEQQSSVRRMPVATWADNYQSEKFDLIFADPPYNNLQLSSVERAASHLAVDGMLILSTPEIQDLPEFDGLKMIDQRTYAQAKISFFVLK